MSLHAEATPAPPEGPAHDAAAHPASLAEMFWAFNRLALQGFGGVLAVTQRELVERLRWLTRDQFVELLALAQVLPGPNVINLSLMIGDRFFGWRGALAAIAGMLLAPLAIVLTLAATYDRFAGVAAVAGALRGMGAIAAGLVIATALKLLPSFRSNPLGSLVCSVLAAASCAAVAWLRWPLVVVIGGLGTLAVGLAWHRSRG